ncbi:hypothetical protein FQN60_001554, partial [Etheostoma spectabile]
MVTETDGTATQKQRSIPSAIFFFFFMGPAGNVLNVPPCRCFRDIAANDESMAAVLFTNLLSQLDRVRSQEQNFLQRHNMKIIQQQLQVKYAANPAVMARVISTCLREERRILSSACMQEQGPLEKSLQNSVAFERQKTMDTRVGNIRASVQLMDQAVKFIEDIQDDFDFRYKTLQSRVHEPSQLFSYACLCQEILSKMDVVIKEIDDLMTSFVVEKQPCMPTHPQKPLIIKTGVQFTTKVRLLVKLPEVDYQLKVKTTFDKSRQFFILTNNTKVMDIEDYSNGCLSVEFRHLQLKEKKYINGTKGNEGLLSVTEELHYLSFEACFTVQGLTIDLETCSLPLVVISNVSQLPGGWASNLAFFGNPPRATWSQLSEVLSWQFSTFAGQGLNREQLTMLGEKLLGQHASCSDYQVSWSKFSK